MYPDQPMKLMRSGRVVKNRSVLAAMTNQQSHEDGQLSTEEITWLLRRAQGDFGITTTAAANVTEKGRGWKGEFGVWGDHQLPGLTQLAKQLQVTGTISLVQLFHGGMRAPMALNGVQPISASENTEASMNGMYTREMTDHEILAMIEAFTAAAIRCKQAGFDGVELHGAHSYLISQFLGTKTNRRTDRWGGDIIGRSRFLREIVKAVRSATGPDFILAVRISPIIETAGIQLQDSLALATMLGEMDIDLLHISCWDVFQTVTVDGQEISLTKCFATLIPKKVPLISTGAVWTTKDAQWLLDEGADLVGVARAGLAHPDWPKHLGDPEWAPQRPPFTEQHLLDVDLSPKFVSYMKRWKNFVIPSTSS